MKKTTHKVTARLNSCLINREEAASELQNEVNQLLAASLLWIRFAKADNKLYADESVYNAEKNLKEAIERVRALHYALTSDILVV